MNTFLIRSCITILVVAFSAGFISCKTTVSARHPKSATIASQPLPPGQAKKLTGEKSAKKYAPGQQKKKKKKQ